MRYARRKKPPPAAVHPRENGSLHICSRLNTCADKCSIYAHTQAQESSSKGPENAPTEAHSPMRSWAPRGGGDRAPRAGGPPPSRTRGHREPARHLRYVRRRVAVWAALPLGHERAILRGRHCHSGLDVPFRYARCRVAVWSALPLGPERAAPRSRHCHSGLDAPSWYVRRRVAVWVALPRAFAAIGHSFAA